MWQFRIALVLSFLLMGFTPFNCSEKFATEDCEDCAREEIQLLLDDGKCKEAKERALGRFPELVAIANLCIGGPSLSCLLDASDSADNDGGEKKSFFALAYTCATGGKGLIKEALNSNRLDDSNTVIALMYLLIETIANSNSSACFDGDDSTTCSATLDGFSEADFQELKDLIEQGLAPSEAEDALKRCGTNNDETCSSLDELKATF